jgi:hypothetical protein
VDKPKSESGLRTTGDPWLDLVAGVVRVAVQDARRGHEQAIRWLDSFYPDWRQRVNENQSQVEERRCELIEDLDFQRSAPVVAIAAAGA